jgi:hypothetical protein
VRRPHPRFDPSRNAWVTRAGGRLKILAEGPKTPESESAAWTAFYAHMANLGNPVPSDPSAISLGQLADEFGSWMRQVLEAGRKRLKTLDYYQHNIQRFIDKGCWHAPVSSVGLSSPLRPPAAPIRTNATGRFCGPQTPQGARE